MNKKIEETRFIRVVIGAVVIVFIIVCGQLCNEPKPTAYDSPLGAKTAMRIAIPACSSSHPLDVYRGHSFIYQDRSTAPILTAHSCSVWVKLESGESRFLIWNYSIPSEAGTETLCNVGPTWTNCEHSWTQLNNTEDYIGFGCLSTIGHTELDAGTYYIAGFNCVVGATNHRSFQKKQDSNLR